MEGSPYRKFSISWKGAQFQGPNSGFLLAGTWSVPFSGTRGSGSYLEAGGNDTGVFFPNSLPLISRFRHRSRGITCALKSTGVAHSQQAPFRQDPFPLVLLAWLLLSSGYDEAGILILSCVQAGENRRDDAGNGLFKVFVFSGNTLFLLILYSEPSRMTDGFDLVLGSSSIGTRVHSRHRVGNEVCESMDSSSSSLELTAKIGELRNATAGEALPPPGGDRLSPVGSSIDNRSRGGCKLEKEVSSF
ncbi:hypothetical protein F2Q68_00044617 [Brassica cretica]|uniref:Uncharacterized protein n=1 Tax=Brassica cretica TaxID=69181 RepID=A0A8S9LID3_BRACR|nr:hypothetical protein F2Q68_00044617 [Brassica cretica]